MNDRLPANLVRHAVQLVREAGDHGPVSVQPMAGGRNSRVFRVEASRQEYVLKQYFFSPHDQRDRLHHEFSFAGFAWSRGIRCVPRPIALDRRHRMGLYEMIRGQVATYRPTSRDDILQAAAFLMALHRERLHPEAGHLPWAAESASSLMGHIVNVQQRIERLSQLRVESDLDCQAHRIVQSELLPLWSEVGAIIGSQIERDGESSRVLRQEELWLSPSDFGFHNAMEEPGGRLRFIDFEFAGWDDPAKLLCDFIHQPDRPLSADLAATFFGEVTERDVNPDFLRWRYRLLTLLCYVKWGCIILNDFLPFGRARQRFTGSDGSQARKQAQLEKLRAVLARGRHSVEQWHKEDVGRVVPEPKVSLVNG